MEEHVLNDDVARKFLLGQLSAEEQGHIEELAFENPETFVFLQAAESDLIDEFLDDDLSPEEKESFRQYFLKQPGRRTDLRVARAMQQYLAQQPAPTRVSAIDIPPGSLPGLLRIGDIPYHEAPEPESSEDTPITEVRGIDPHKGFSLVEWFSLHVSPFTVSMAAAALLVGAIGVLLLVKVIVQKDREPVQARQDQPTPVPTTTPTSTATPSPSSSPVHKETPNKPPSTPRQPARAAYAILLSPGVLMRSEGSEDLIEMPSATVPFELPLTAKGSFQRYSAELKRNEKTIFRWPNLQPRELKNGKGFEAYVPPGLLKPDQSYRIVLSGVSANGRSKPLHYYAFKVNQKVQP